MTQIKTSIDKRPSGKWRVRIRMPDGSRRTHGTYDTRENADAAVEDMRTTQCRIEKGDGWELRLGAWQDVLMDVMPDACITDPPYSDRVHRGMKVNGGIQSHAQGRDGVAFSCMTSEMLKYTVDHWCEKTKSWCVFILDDGTACECQNMMRDPSKKRLCFQLVPFVEMGKQPRIHGDGPASWSCFCAVSRPREGRFKSWGSLPGAYVPPTGIGVQRDRLIKGGKPLWLMRNLVRDYSKPDDLVCDPYAGAGTTLLAAVIEGRRAIGAELDEKTFQIAVDRLQRGYTRSLFVDQKIHHKSNQQSLFGGTA